MLAKAIRAGALTRALAALLASTVGLSISPATAQDARISEARAIGKVSWYTSVAPDELRKALIDEFKAKTGLDVSVYYGGTGQIFSRLNTERKTKAYNVDVVTLGDTDLVKELASQNALRKYVGVNAKEIQDVYRGKDETWVGICFWGLTMAINTNALKPADAPKAWIELADPKWKGRLVISDPARSAGGLLLLKAMVKEQGWDWMTRLLQNDPLIIAVAPGIDQALANGERILATSVTSFLSETLKAKAPVMPIGDLLITSPLTASVIVEAPNPKGAELFVDYLTSKSAGELFRKYGWFSSRPDVEGPFGFPSAANLKVIQQDVDIGMTRQQILDRYAEIARGVGKR